MELIGLGKGSVVGADGTGAGVDEKTIYVKKAETKKSRGRHGKSRFEAPVGATVVDASWILDEIVAKKK